MAMNVGFVGVGAVGSTLARALSRAEVPVAAVAGRSRERATRLAEELSDCTAFGDAQSVVDRADLVFLTVPDDAIEAVCDGLTWSAGMSVVHCSGAHSAQVLSSAARAGAQVGACHPMQAFPGSGERAEHLKGCMFGVEADEPLRGTLSDLVSRIGGWPLFLESQDKATYHLAGVIASNYLVTLAASATALLEDLGVTSEEALTGLLPILRGTVNNLDSRGLPIALTGPISRGDTGTIDLHLRTLVERHPELLSLYVEMGRRTIPIARNRGGLSGSAQERLQALFDEYQAG
jgi:predicted short-subunit dehydrogenase-like oxidoreductase (DUF2520 family)